MNGRSVFWLLAALVAAGVIFVLLRTARIDHPTEPGTGGSSRARREADRGSWADRQESAETPVVVAGPTSAKLPQSARAPAADRSGALPPFEVLVLDGSQNPVAGALVEIEVRDATVARETTDTGGKLSLGEMSVGVPLSIQTSATGFAPRMLRFEHNYPRPIRVVLDAEASLRGKVSLPDGTSPGPGLHLVARKRTERASLRDLAIEAVNGSLATGHALTDSKGRFEIQGLQPTGRYDLIAGGFGKIVEEKLEGLRPSASEIDVTVMNAYTYALRYVEANGQAVNRAAAMSNGTITAPPDGRAELAGDAIPASILGGLQIDLALQPDIVIQVFVDPTAPASVGPIVVTDNTPGYRPVRAAVSALPLTSGAVVTNIVYEPITQGWGAIRVRFVHAPPDFAESVEKAHAAYPGHRPHCASVFLADAADQYEFYLYPDFGDTWTASHVPQGDYRLRIKSRDGYFLDPPKGQPARSIHVGDEPLEMVCELDGTGSIEVNLSLLDQSDYTGRHLFDLRPSQKTGQVEWVNFEHAPYVFPVIPAGEYRLCSHFPGYFVDEHGSQLTTLEVGPGRRTVISLRERKTE